MSDLTPENRGWISLDGVDVESDRFLTGRSYIRGNRDVYLGYRSDYCCHAAALHIHFILKQ